MAFFPARGILQGTRGKMPGILPRTTGISRPKVSQPQRKTAGHVKPHHADLWLRPATNAGHFRLQRARVHGIYRTTIATSHSIDSFWAPYFAEQLSYILSCQAPFAVHRMEKMLRRNKMWIFLKTGNMTICSINKEEKKGWKAFTENLAIPTPFWPFFEEKVLNKKTLGHPPLFNLGSVN